MQIFLGGMSPQAQHHTGSPPGGPYPQNPPEFVNFQFSCTPLLFT